MNETCDIGDTVVMVRSSWPSTICPRAGLHWWGEGELALECMHCGQVITYVDCASYRSWTWHWMGRVLANTVAVLN